MTSSEKRRLLNLSLISLFFFLISLFFASEAYFWNIVKGYKSDFVEKLGWNLIRWIPWAFFAPIIIQLIKRYPIYKEHWIKPVLMHMLFSTIFSVIQTVTYYIFHWMSIGYVDLSPGIFMIACIKFAHFNLLTYWVIIGVFYGIDYYRKSKEQELRACRLEQQLTHAQLEVLKMQLHPHFLFNTLHAISALIHKEPEKADKVISLLSDLLRLTLDNSDLQEITLKEEIEFLNIYLEIQKTRFQERLLVKVDMHPETCCALVPNLILQPLIENSIRHGIAPLKAGGKIEIKSVRQENKLIITINDNGNGFNDVNENQRHNIGRGIGLKNTMERLNQLYGENHKFILRSSDKKGTQVLLEIPFKLALQQSQKNGRGIE